MTPIRTLLVYASGEVNKTFSYQTGWPQQFLAHRAFRCTPINLLDRRWHSRVGRALKVRQSRADAVVLLHSVFSNGRLLDGHLFDAIRKLACCKAYFIGNEYKLIPEKMQFCEDLGISLLVSQTTDATVHQMYRERLGCAVVGIPNTGFDPVLFRATQPWAGRPIDVGYRADHSPRYLGHQERQIGRAHV